MKTKDRGPRPQKGSRACGVCAAATFLGQSVILPLGRTPPVIGNADPRLKWLDPAAFAAEATEQPSTRAAAAMSSFDATGGPWGFWLRPSLATSGIDVYFPPNTFSNQPMARLIGTIPDATLYVGGTASTEVYVSRHTWYNQGAQYRSIVANYPTYPGITVVDYMNLWNLRPFLSELVVTNQGEVDLSTLLPLLANTAITGNPTMYQSLLALLSSCAATDVQRKQLASALALSASMADILLRHGVLLYNKVGLFSTADLSAVDTVLGLYPDPIKDQLHLLMMDESTLAFSVAGGYASGGIINIAAHASSKSGFVAYPGGGSLPEVNSLQAVLVHEMGHMVDVTSVGFEQERYTVIYNSGATDPDAYLYRTIFPSRTEDIIFYWLGYCTDSRTILNEVAARRNGVLTQKLSHTIDLMPSLTPGLAPFFTTDPATQITSMSYVPINRGHAAYLGDDGMITLVNGISF